MNTNNKPAAQLTLLRHGESIWNQQNRFTGWVDVSLSRAGMEEAGKAGLLLKEQRFDVAFTSSLLRAQDTLYEVLKQNSHCDQYIRVHESGSQWYEHFAPSKEDLNELSIYISNKLNERYYGDLQGRSKQQVSQEFGAEQVHIWRRSYDVPPPNGESLAMTAERAIPYYQEKIVPYLKKGQSVMITAHGNSLRALIMHIEAMTSTQILAYNLETGTPHIYHFDTKMKVSGKQVLKK
jgi:2,3-bisphosphoglycerate-dependent phosphoglycerate mutase